jgi:hypothetical protein
MMISRMEKTSRSAHATFLSKIASCLAAGVGFAQNAERSEGKHGLLLSGQLNLARFKPKKCFTPGIGKAWRAGNVTVCFEAKGGQTISKCFKNGKESKDEADREAGQRCDALTDKMNAATSGIKIQSPCFQFFQSMFWRGTAWRSAGMDVARDARCG